MSYEILTYIFLRVYFVSSSWEFLSEGGDISYRVYCKNADGIVEFAPSDRIDSHLMIEEGQITCSMPGKCINNLKFLIEILAYLRL